MEIVAVRLMMDGVDRGGDGLYGVWLILVRRGKNGGSKRPPYGCGGEIGHVPVALCTLDRCCIFLSTQKFACEFKIEKDAERKRTSSGMSALCEPSIQKTVIAEGNRVGFLNIGSQKAI